MNKPDHPWKAAIKAEHMPKEPGRPKGLTGAAEVEAANLRRAFEESGMSKSELARRMGWIQTKPDIHRVSQILGYETRSNGTKQQRVTYDLAVRLARALEADLVDVGV